jgi:hypothetical protein
MTPERPVFSETLKPGPITVKLSSELREVEIATKGTDVLSKSEVLRIQNAATRINKPIHVVGSRAIGKAGPYSDWDYIIEGGLNSKEWSTIKNSLPGARSILDNTTRMIDIHSGPVWPGYPYITIFPR